MKFLDAVNSEGGPFLIADAEVARKWRGTEDGSSDYEHACQMFLTDPEPPGALISVGSEKALVWETEGAGTGDVFIDGQWHLIIIRSWLDEPNGADTDDELRAVTALVELPLNAAIHIGSLEITSGVLAILWSPESGETIEPLDIGESEHPTGKMATDSSGLLVKIDKGRYSCLHDEVELGQTSARRCHLVKN